MCPFSVYLSSLCFDQLHLARLKKKSWKFLRKWGRFILGAGNCTVLFGNVQLSLQWKPQTHNICLFNYSYWPLPPEFPSVGHILSHELTFMSELRDWRNPVPILKPFPDSLPASAVLSSYISIGRMARRHLCAGSLCDWGYTNTAQGK